MRELQHLAGHHFFQAVHACDAVADGDDGADLVDRHGLIVIRDLRAQDLCNFVRFDRCHAAPLLFGLEARAQPFEPGAHRAVVNR